MITDGGTVNDSSYNQSAWTGVEQAVEEANKDVA